MISTLLAMAPWAAFSVLVAAVLAAPPIGVRLVRLPRTTAVLLGVAVLGVLALTLSPDGDPAPGITCSAGLPYLAPTAVESTANVLLFVPIAFLAGLLLGGPDRPGRAVPAALAASGLSVVVEIVQAVVPVIGRACDTADWITNTIGALVGGALAALSLAWVRRRTAIAEA